MNRTVQIILAIVVLVLVAGGSFYGGMVYGKGQAQASLAATMRQGVPLGAAPGGGFTGQGQPGAGGRGGAQAGMIIGEIQALESGALVITDTSGNQTRVVVTDTTLIEKNASVTLADLKKGETVMVSGSTGSDGTITARSVQVSPAGRFIGGDRQGTGGTQ